MKIDWTQTKEEIQIYIYTNTSSQENGTKNCEQNNYKKYLDQSSFGESCAQKGLKLETVKNELLIESKKLHKDYNLENYEYKNNMVFCSDEILVPELLYSAELIKTDKKANFIEIHLKKLVVQKWNKLTKIEVEKPFIHFKSDIDYNYNIGDYKDSSVEQMLCDIYERGTSNQKKAMNRSFLESNSTFITSNWDDISEGVQKTHNKQKKGEAIYPITNETIDNPKTK